MARPAEAAERETHNTARFFVENRQVGWVLLIAAALWGVWGYRQMPQRKDPDVPVREALVVCVWPGANAKQVEQLVTEPIEKAAAQNDRVSKIDSESRDGLSLVYISLDEYAHLDVSKEFDDVSQKLNSIQNLPQGAGPIRFIKDFGDTAALMLTVASPKAPPREIAVRAALIKQKIEQARSGRPVSSQQFTLLYCCPYSTDTRVPASWFGLLKRSFQRRGIARDMKILQCPGCVALDGLSKESDRQILSEADGYLQGTLKLSSIYPDAWKPVVVRSPADTENLLQQTAGDEYSCSQLDGFTREIERSVKTAPAVSKVSRTGVLPENIFLYYSQDRLAAYGLPPSLLPSLLAQRNAVTPAGQIDMQDRLVTVSASGAFQNIRQIEDTAIAATPAGAPVYLRDLAQVVKGYQYPPGLLNFYNWKDAKGQWHSSRAITLSLQMRPGQQIEAFNNQVNSALAALRPLLPSDLIIARTSDQPLQVQENVSLFMESLIEAAILVILVSWIGFWEWRSALLMALAIPITLALTFGMMYTVGVDVQQVSIATLIIALGLLVDDPVVAGDAIKRDLADGLPRDVAAWSGPTKLATAILFATITNIVAYLPFLMLKGDIGRFIYSLPVVMTCALVASRIVSMTFLPLLGYYLLRPVPEEPMAERRKKGFPAFYCRVVQGCIKYRKAVFGCSLLFLVLGAFEFTQIKLAFFPTDLQYLSTVDIWLPQDANFQATEKAAKQAAGIVEATAAEFGRENHEKNTLVSVTSFVGGAGPRFWFSLTPEQQRSNYAQLVVQVRDKHDTSRLAGVLQEAFSTQMAGVRADVRQLETGKPVGVPVACRISGPDSGVLLQLAEKLKTIYRSTPLSARVRDDWGEPGFHIELKVDQDKAALAGVSTRAVSLAAQAGLSGLPVGILQQGSLQIPIVAQLRPEDRANAQDLSSLYVYSLQGEQRVPISQVAQFVPEQEQTEIRRHDQFRSITVSCFPAVGHLPSEVSAALQPELASFAKTLPPGYRFDITGEQREQQLGFDQLAVVLVISVLLIYAALTFQFRDAVKPFIVFAAVPYGMVSSLLALRIMGQPFGFMAFLGMVSLVGVIVSHIIVLFDFVEEARRKGEKFEEALLEAGIIRLRPILITVGATIFALFPLAAHGGPLWQPLCFAQIGGLGVATFLTLLLTPTLYAIFVMDLKIVKWGTE